MVLMEQIDEILMVTTRIVNPTLTEAAETHRLIHGTLNTLSEASILFAMAAVLARTFADLVVSLHHQDTMTADHLRDQGLIGQAIVIQIILVRGYEIHSETKARLQQIQVVDV
jgi:hypothetical protein